MVNLLETLYDTEKEEIYLSENIINIKNLNNYIDDLINSNEYIPNLLQSHLGLKYYNHLRTQDNNEIIKKMNNTRKQSVEDDYMELLNWIDEHPQYNNILNEKVVKNIGDKLEDLEKEYNDYYTIKI